MMDELEHRLTDALHADAHTVNPHGTAWNGQPPPARRGWPTWLAIAAAVAAVMIGATFVVTRHDRTPETANPPIQSITPTASPTGSAAPHPCSGGWTASGTAVITGTTQSTDPGTTAILRFAGDTSRPATLCAVISSADGTTLASGSADQTSAGLGYLTMITGQQTYLVGAFSGPSTTITVAPGAAPGLRGESGNVTATATTDGVLDLGNGWHGYAILAPRTASSAVQVTASSANGTVLGRRNFALPAAASTPPTSSTSPTASSATASTPPPTSQPTSSSSVTTQPGRTLQAQQPAWAEKGRELIAQQKAHPPIGVANSTPFAYRSDAFDLTNDGKYDVVFHVPASFSLTPPADGRAISLGYAVPDDCQCRLQQSGIPSLVETRTGYDLHCPFYASGVSFAYPGFSIWLY